MTKSYVARSRTYGLLPARVIQGNPGVDFHYDLPYFRTVLNGLARPEIDSIIIARRHYSEFTVTLEHRENYAYWSRRMAAMPAMLEPETLDEKLVFRGEAEVQELELERYMNKYAQDHATFQRLYGSRVRPRVMDSSRSVLQTLSMIASPHLEPEQLHRFNQTALGQTNLKTLKFFFAYDLNANEAHVALLVFCALQKFPVSQVENLLVECFEKQVSITTWQLVKLLELRSKNEEARNAPLEFQLSLAF